MAYIEQVEIDDAQGDTQKLYQESIRRAGGVANIIRVMGQDGASANGSMQLYLSVMKRRNSLSTAQKEMLAAVVSNVNDCFY
jgi:homoserine dehydrogenase